MFSDFTFSDPKIAVHKLQINDKYKSGILLQLFLAFWKDEFYNDESNKQFQIDISEALDELEKEDWTKKRILEVISERMSEHPSSAFQKEITIL